MSPDFVAGREAILDFLKRELVGPCPVGDPIDCSGAIVFSDAAAAAVPRIHAGTNEEILLRDAPGRRYGIGVLYPQGVKAGEDEDTVPIELDPVAGHDLLTESALHDIDSVAQRQQYGRGDSDEGFDLSGANDYEPSSMAVSFLVRLGEGSKLVVTVSAGRYRRKQVSVLGKDRWWWLRQQVSGVAEISAAELVGPVARICREDLASPSLDGLRLSVETLTRPRGAKDTLLATVCLVNRSEVRRPEDEQALFQCRFSVRVVGSRGDVILPYPGTPTELLDEEEESLELLFRRSVTYAVGHGCSADWQGDDSGSAQVVIAEPLPVFELPSVTPDVVDRKGQELRVPMSALAGLGGSDPDLSSLDPLLDAYETWIAVLEREADGLDKRHRAAAQRHIAACKKALERMRDGLRLLVDDAEVLKAFSLANLAVLTQQLNGARPKREAASDPETRKYVFTPAYAEPPLGGIPDGIGRWRPFQIAFVLMCLRSVASKEAPDRDAVELLWFPTGGGKTEAYLALAAFSIFLRRLRNNTDVGTEVLMRYTLRLLTTQQFQRAARLVCAMEWIRRREIARLGDRPFSIGIWLGGETTPNRRRDALETYRSLIKGDRFARNKFLLDRCPWCRAPIGPYDMPQGGKRKEQIVLGLQQAGGSVLLHCPDRLCLFSRCLPVLVVDEDIYEAPPDLVIGTVDKFALLAWRPESRALFGLDRNGARTASPPGLVIQDELHLISGPLGSMVGLYETLVDELCTDRRNLAVRPKIVCSTATIRRYREQTRALYRRTDVSLFPPPGLSISDSFFSREARNTDGSRAPGRLYVGVNAPSFGSLQTIQVRTLSALLQAPLKLTALERDPWWTLLIFFNSLRELGGTLSLLQSDIPDYLKVLRNRLGLDWPDVRRLRHILELTSRLENDEVPEAIDRLEQSTAGANAQDVCLASNIIEVGIDIDRLSLMALVGQPKTTSQYIQVTGRVGRSWWERPGLVVTIYSASKARDRSHYEHFRSYHERLYAQVEPTSVTPFSGPVLERALHAVLAAYSRQMGNQEVATSPHPYPRELVEQFAAVLARHVDMVDPAQASDLERIRSRRIAEWKSWRPRLWSDQQGNEVPLLYAAGSYVDPAQANRSWATPNSLRTVDAECQAEVSPLYDQNVP